MTSPADQYVQDKVQPQHRPTVEALRALMAEHASRATEVISYGSLAWRGNKILAIVSASRTHITFAFERGAEFTDEHGKLQGVGKKTRHVKIKSPDALDAVVLRDYIRQADALDQA